MNDRRASLPTHPPGALAKGERLGAYEISRLIGFGGMGQVYRAVDTRLGREVAIKVLSPVFVGDERGIRRLAAEARAASMLNHPNLLTVFELGESDRGPYVVTELIDGRTVREELREGPLVLERALDIARQAAEGLARAHAGGIVHRDVKPDNLMVRADGLVKILDFGLAKPAPGAPGGPDRLGAPRTDTGFVMGTNGYMSPEQARGEAVGPASDVFQLGIVLHEMVSGRHPFLGSSSAETMAAILRADPEPLEIPSAPQAAEIIRRCLAKRASDRFASASELAAELASILAARAADGAAPASESAPSPGEPRRRRLFSFVLGAAIVLAAAALMVRSASAKAAPGPAGTELALRSRQEGATMSETPRSMLMPESSTAEPRRDEQVGENRRDQSFQEVPAPQGLKTPPATEVGEDSGEWTRGGGADPNELEDTQPSPGDRPDK